MGGGDPVVKLARHEHVREGQHQAGHADGEQQHERHEVIVNSLRDNFCLVAHPPSNRDCHASQAQDGGNVEQVKNNPTNKRPDRERGKLEPESKQDRHILTGILEHTFKANPAEGQWEGDQNCQQAAPENQLVGNPALF